MPDDAAIVTAFLAGRHVACPACGYDLCGAADGVCPECGDRLRLTLHSSTPRREPLTVALRWSACWLAASGALWLVYFTVMTIRSGRGIDVGWPGLLYGLWHLTAVTIGVLIWLLLRGRRGSDGRAVAAVRMCLVWFIINGLYAALNVAMLLPW